VCIAKVIPGAVKACERWITMNQHIAPCHFPKRQDSLCWRDLIGQLIIIGNGIGKLIDASDRVIVKEFVFYYERWYRKTRRHRPALIKK